MSARKAYISSLGTTGLLIAAALAMLIVVGALGAFDRWPSQAVAEAESVPVAPGSTGATHRYRQTQPLAGSAARAARHRAASYQPSRASLLAAATRAGRFERSTRPAAPASTAVSQPVISDLPAPTSAPEAPARPAPAQPAPEPPVAPRTPVTTPPVITPDSLV